MQPPSEPLSQCSDLLQPALGWVGAARPRMVPPDSRERGLLLRTVSALSGLIAQRPVPDIFLVLHLNPRLFWAWLFFASRLMPFGKLPARLREKIILRTAWNCRSRYEWGQHVALALEVGVSASEILALARGPAACASPEDRILMQACDEMCESKYISDGTWAILASHYREPLLIEIMLLIGHYEMVAGFLNSSGICLEPSVEATLQKFHQNIATA